MNSALRTVSFTVTDVADVNGVVTALATASTEVTLTGAAELNGAALSGTTPRRFTKLPRTLTITLSAAVGSYTTDDIVVTGTRGGAVVTETFNPSDADGGETLTGTVVFDAITNIVIAAQVDTSGQWEFGTAKIATPSAADKFCAVELLSDGTLTADYSSDGSITDALPLKANSVREIAPYRIGASVALIAYMPYSRP